MPLRSGGNLRTSHPYEEGIAVRLICGLQLKADEVVVALFAGERTRIGDVWYSSVGHRADMVISQWQRESVRRRDEGQAQEQVEDGDGDD